MSCRTPVSPKRGAEFSPHTDHPEGRSVERPLLGLLDGLLNGLGWAALLLDSMPLWHAVRAGLVVAGATMVVAWSIGSLPQRRQRTADIAHILLWSVAVGLTTTAWHAMLRTLLSGKLVMALAAQSRRAIAVAVKYGSAIAWIRITFVAQLARIELRYAVRVARIQMGKA